jgi:phosphoribosylamine-glycine ligase
MAQERLRILVVGSGGREHALAWKLSQSSRVDIVYVAPGNGGTAAGASSKIENANIKGDDYPGLVAFAQENQVNLVVPGPEAPLVDGIQGYFQAGLSSHPPENPPYQLMTVLKSVLGALVHQKPPHVWRAPRPFRKIS